MSWKENKLGIDVPGSADAVKIAAMIKTTGPQKTIHQPAPL
jgi:hypothetical protein